MQIQLSKHIIVNMLELLNALDNSSIGNDAKFTRFMVFKTKQSGISRRWELVNQIWSKYGTDRVKLTDLPI